MRGALTPFLYRALGMLLIVGVFVLTLPLSLPRLMGYEVFEVVSGSMEPDIPVGSAIYVRSVDASDVQVDEVIAFYDEDAVVAHRVVENRISDEEFVTKGDANNTQDSSPVAYDALIGAVALHVPLVGRAMTLYASNVGKVYLMLTLACGVMLNILADGARRRRSQKLREQLERRLAEGMTVEEKTMAAAWAEELHASRSGGWVRTAVMVGLALIFVGSGAVVAFVNWQYHLGDEAYDTATTTYVHTAEVEKPDDEVPIQIDFEELLSVNPDVQGWIYCEGTDINYPVMRGETNDTYLRHDYRGEYNVRGSIFVDADNRAGFTDANTIIYGHHMSSGTMFAMLEDWESQAYYEEHPCMWLLTPEQDYQVVLLSAKRVSAYSDLYEIHHEHDEGFERFLAEVMAESDLVPVEGAEVDHTSNYVMLTTCSYTFESARYIIFGKLVPVSSAGGVALPTSG